MLSFINLTSMSLMALSIRRFIDLLLTALTQFVLSVVLTVFGVDIKVLTCSRMSGKEQSLPQLTDS